VRLGRTTGIGTSTNLVDSRASADSLELGTDPSVDSGLDDAGENSRILTIEHEACQNGHGRRRVLNLQIVDEADERGLGLVDSHASLGTDLAYLVARHQPAPQPLEVPLQTIREVGKALAVGELVALIYGKTREHTEEKASRGGILDGLGDRDEAVAKPHQSLHLIEVLEVSEQSVDLEEDDPGVLTVFRGFLAILGERLDHLRELWSAAGTSAIVFADYRTTVIPVAVIGGVSHVLQKPDLGLQAFQIPVV